MMVKVSRVGAFVFMFLVTFSSAFPESSPVPVIPQIAVLDIQSSSYEEGKRKLLTDVFRSELFKTKLFHIIDRGAIIKAISDNKLTVLEEGGDLALIALGKALRTDKIFACSVEKFADSYVINVRVVDVDSAIVDFTDNVFVKNEGLLLDALKEIVSKIELSVASVKSETEKPEDSDSRLKETWLFLGAGEEDLSYLMTNAVDPDEYLGLRQYDIGFSVKEYAKAKRSRLDIGSIRTFLQNGISYALADKAMTLGVQKLDKFRTVFAPAGYDFEDYLEAYERGIATVGEYKEYKNGFKKDFFSGGLGGVADSLPIMNANFKFGLAQASWEHFWTKYQRDWGKYSADVGIYMMNFFAPVPFVHVNAYFGAPPYYGKLGLGLCAEVLLGGHIGCMALVGIELLEHFEFDLITVFAGTQPGVSYTDLKSRPGSPTYYQIAFPYYGAMFRYKL